MPESGRILLTGTGREFIERVGLHAIRNAVLGILKGENLRTQTEFLTRNRLCQLNAAIIALYIKGLQEVKGFSNNLYQIARQQLGKSKKSDRLEHWPALWFVGMTDKQFQNVLRSDQKNYDEYIVALQSTIDQAVQSIQQDMGCLKMQLGYIDDWQSGKVVELSWKEILQITTAIGAQTLAIRGSEKSLYGKLFERLVLGTAFSLLGFTMIDSAMPDEEHYKKSGSFWLSDNSANRECDGTIVYAPWKVARFDIGFIGKGNPEITKDKLSRFESRRKISGRDVVSKTFVIVDRLPDTTTTKVSAKKSNTQIVQMSMSYWIKDLAEKMQQSFGFEHSLLQMSDTGVRNFLESRIEKIDMFAFLPKSYSAK